MRKVLLILCVMVVTFPLAGCWDRKEISELALVMAKGVDLVDGNMIRVSVQVAIPSKVGGSTSGGKGGGNSYFVVSATGRTLSEADAHVQQRLPRQLYLPHLRMIMVGDRMARNGMDKILDHFGRNPPNRLRSTILVAKDSDALPLLQTTYPLEALSGEAVRKLERQLTGTNTTLLDFMIEAASDGTDEMASAVSFKTQNDQAAGAENQGGGGYYLFKNTAVFRELKLVGYLNSAETIAAQWLHDRLKYGTLTMEVPNTNGMISVQLSQVDRRAKTFVQGNNVAVQYYLSGSAMLIENTTGLDADNPETLKMFQAAVNKYVEEIVKTCLSTLGKQYDADAAGVGLMVYHQHPYDWERLKPNWHQLFPNVKYIVQSEVQIVEGGKSGPPLYGKTKRGILHSNEPSNQEGDSTQ